MEGRTLRKSNSTVSHDFLSSGPDGGSEKTRAVSKKTADLFIAKTAIIASVKCVAGMLMVSKYWHSKLKILQKVSPHIFEVKNLNEAGSIYFL